MLFPELNSSSKVWVYNSNRELLEEEVTAIKEDLKPFLKEWAAHGDSLFGAADILHNRFVVLTVDESQVYASGCSIDTSVRFIKELGAKYDVDFFDRMNLTIEEDGSFKRVHISDLSNYPNAHVFNPMITSLNDLRENWKINVLDSPFV